ncbi:hypothetical protein [Larkinella terrae]|uniref:hypothetical protein n=1 Tax=Larkinella terrae TaxID=2025311 RepID=UPI001E50A838|nr:hypothetical protein [Larkinella terrae]
MVYTIKTLHTTIPTQYPDFWNEEWLKRAINELDTRRMTPEERAYFARVTAANAEAVKAENKRIEEVKESIVINLLQQTDFEMTKVSTIAGVSIEFVEKVKSKISPGK